MSDDAFERLLDREVRRFAEEPAAARPGDEQLIDRALGEVGRSRTAASGSGFELAGVVAGAAVVGIFAWWALRSPPTPSSESTMPTVSAPAPIDAAKPAVPASAPDVPVRAAAVPEEPAVAASPEVVTEGDPSGPSPGPTAAELLRRAQQQRGAGQTGAAATTYRDLLEAHPRSAEAKISLLSLAEIELVERGRAGRALRYFDRYLRGGGPLSEEALHGRVRALRQLGRAREELEAIDALLAAHPDSVYAGSVEKRRAELLKPGG